MVWKLEAKQDLTPQGKILLEPQKDFILDDRYFGSAKYTIDNRVQDMLIRIAECKKGIYRMPHHKDCGAPLLEEPVQFTCDNKYCKCDLCIERRQRKAWHRLKEFKIRSKRLIHLILGFERKFTEDNNTKQDRENIIRGIKKELKPYNIKGLMIWDMEVKEKRKLKSYFMHFHLAVLPVKDYRTFMLTIRKIQEKFLGKATIVNKGFRPKKALLNYFSKIMAGLLSGNVYGAEEHHELLYPDLMSPDEFHKFFYRKRALRVIALKKLRRPPSESEGYVPLMGASLPENCPGCGEFLTPGSIFYPKHKIEPEPPPDIQNSCRSRHGVVEVRA